MILCWSIGVFLALFQDATGYMETFKIFPTYNITYLLFRSTFMKYMGDTIVLPICTHIPVQDRYQ